MAAALSRREQREAFINRWYQYEKTAHRIGAVVLLFASALIAALEHTDDQWTAIGMVVCLTMAITLLVQSRRARAERAKLRFLKVETQNSRSTMAGMGAVVLITQMGTRPLALIIGGLLAILAIWYQWRAYQIRQFDALGPEMSSKPENQE